MGKSHHWSNLGSQVFAKLGDTMQSKLRPEEPFPAMIPHQLLPTSKIMPVAEQSNEVMSAFYFGCLNIFEKQKSKHSSNSNPGQTPKLLAAALLFNYRPPVGSISFELYQLLPISHSPWHLEVWEFQSPSCPQILFLPKQKEI